jgi:integrase
MVVANPQTPYVLFQRAGSDKWWVRFSIRGEGQIRKPLGTADQQHAARLALELWAEANHRHKQGLHSQTKSFAAVAAEFVAQLQAEATRGERRQFQVDQYRRKVERYLVGFFGNKMIDQLRHPDITRFWEWRISYWISGPGKDIQQLVYMRNGRQIRKPIGPSVRKPPSRGTLREEGVILRMLLSQAASWGYVDKAHIPDIEVRAVPANARPSFEAAEFTKLEQTSLARLGEQTINTHLRRDRTILHCYILIAGFTGMRPTELKNLNWGDILGYRDMREKPIGERDIRIRARGKGKARTFIPMEAALPWFDMLWQLWVAAQKTAPTDMSPVFATMTGLRLSSVKKGLGELLKASELSTDHRGMRRTSYSFRHFYISQQLIAGVDIFLLARNTGTSPDMIDRFYGHVKLERMTKELRPEWRG